MTKTSAWCKIVEAVTAPLGFFVLALLIVESFLASVVIGGNLERSDQMTGVWMGVVLFIIVNIAVFVLVWSKPENLTFDKEAHLISHGKIYGSETHGVRDPEDLPTDRSPPTATRPQTPEVDQ